MTAVSVPTVVVELTPPGRAAVAVVLVAGPRALEAIRQFFVPVKPWHTSEPQIGRIMLGRWGGAHGEELVVCRRDENQFEIHCHGGAAAAPAVVEQLVAFGCERQSWQEWLKAPRGRVSPTREIASRRDAATCAAEIALANAPTARAAAVLLDQYHGALSKAVQAAEAAVLAADWPHAAEIIDGILAFHDLGLHLTTPWRVAVAGAPNVGKSSLMNAIAGFQRAIVSPMPGTTRDVVTLTTAISGWPVQLADTAGFRETHDELESAGVALAGAAVADADLVIVVSDATKGDISQGILGRLSVVARMIHAVNKVDLTLGGGDAPARSNPQSAIREPHFVSALTGQGIAELIAAIAAELVPTAPPVGAAVAFTAEQIAGLQSARHAIERRNPAEACAELQSLLARNT
jgi:tRNA modification GTPase